MDRRSFVTWITGVGATLSLPNSMRPSMKWRPAQQFWVSHRYDWVQSSISKFYFRESKEMFVPVTSEHAPSFGYGTAWDRKWAEGIEPNFSLGAGMPDAALKTEVVTFSDRELINTIPKHCTTSMI